MSDNSPPRKPLHERTDSLSNTRAGTAAAGIRLVPNVPQLLGQRDEIYSRTGSHLPTHPSHFLTPGKGKGPALDDEFQRTTKAQAASSSSGSPVITTHTPHQPPQYGNSATGSPISRPKPLPRKRLHIHSDNKTFSLLQDDSQSVQDDSKSLSSKHRSSDSLLSDPSNAGSRRNSIGSCVPGPHSPVVPTTPAPQNKQPISADPISNSPWNYQLVGGLRKVPKTPDLKQKAATTSDSPLPPLPETSDGPPALSHDLSTKPSFQSTETTNSEHTNYKVYAGSESSSEPIFHPPSIDDNYQVIGSPSPTSSIIYRPQTAASEDENENYQLHGDPSPSTSFVNLPPPGRYSQESLVVPPLRPRARRSNENLGYYKSRSRESLRTGSLTSISTVLSQQEALRAIVGSGSLIQLPILKQKPEGPSSWENPLRLHPARSHMNEHPHQWSSQLSTVLSVSDGGTDRGSRSWSDGRISSGFPSSTSRHSRQMLSISSSMAQEETISRSESIEPPTPAFVQNGQRHHSSSSIGIVSNQDEFGDGITDMQDLNLRTRPSRSRLSGFFSISDNGRTNTMRSTTSSRANSLLGNSIPTWAKLYYGSGERRYLGAPGSSTEGTDSRSNSFRTGSPNTDHFPLSIYSPRRRPREVNPRDINRSARGSLEISPAPQLGSDGRLIHDPHAGRFRTWSMSSIWSPHLRLDRRATRRSVWEPPSINWSTEGGMFGRRNIQIVMFIAGFVFPFAWMIAALLPLPPSPMRDMRERDNSTSNLDSSNDVPNDYARQFGPMDEVRYESAKWWRGLNRWMSILGLLVIVAVVVLVIISIREGW
ncbi:uncharacterized protein LY89DRAFT_234471 [Mollisia scopiformis]|uniref:Serine-rich protein n=1 Tax=Mollisia scopiformis TaxID=149040 RepID=A0A194WUZ1_MOLSC|nr:uncharacterized protein LY89DRAFT_234471 [Mollisia scopiformis]KUJ11788.1 hypothetical protein LY89DRAFT_234471 [Mollisia scopiformis]